MHGLRVSRLRRRRSRLGRSDDAQNQGGVRVPGPVEKWRCARKLWDWRLHYGEANWEAILGEANGDRRGCSGFLRHTPGVSPADHFKLESEAREFRRKLLLGLLPLVYTTVGGTIGVVIGWLLKP